MRVQNQQSTLPDIKLVKSKSMTNLPSTTRRLSQQRSVSMPQLSAEVVVSNAASIAYEFCKTETAAAEGHNHVLDVLQSHATESLVQSIAVCMWRLL